MTDTPDLHDDDLRTLVRSAGAPAGIDFRADLRARLAATIDGDVELEPSRPGRSTPAWFTAAAAAAVLALLVGAIVLLARGPTPDAPPVADGSPETDLTSRLVGPTWVAIDVDRGIDLPTMAFRVGTTRPEVILVSGNADCNDLRGELDLDGDTVARADLIQTAAGCPYDDGAVALPVTGATLRIEGSVLTITNGAVATQYVAVETLPLAPLAALDGTWRVGTETVEIVGGRLEGGPTLGSSNIALLLQGEPTIQVIDDDRLLLGGGRTELGPGRFVRLDRVITPPSTTTPTSTTVASPLDEIIGRIWVGVDRPWRTASPTLVFDSLDRAPGLWGVSAFDGCNAGSITFRLDGGTMAAVEGGLTEAACEPEHTVAGLTNGTTLALDGSTLTVSDGTITTTYVALDSLPRVPDPELDGTWVIAGAEFSITGDSAQTAQGSEDLTAAVGRGIAAEPIEAWPYDLGWILGTGDAYLQLLPSDLPYGVDPVVTTGELEAGEEALITGTVALERGCLVLVTGDRLTQVVWQPGTAWDPSTGQVVLPGGVFLARGSHGSRRAVATTPSATSRSSGSTPRGSRRSPVRRPRGRRDRGHPEPGVAGADEPVRVIGRPAATLPTHVPGLSADGSVGPCRARPRPHTSPWRPPAPPEDAARRIDALVRSLAPSASCDPATSEAAARDLRDLAVAAGDEERAIEAGVWLAVHLLRRGQLRESIDEALQVRERLGSPHRGAGSPPHASNCSARSRSPAARPVSSAVALDAAQELAGDRAVRADAVAAFDAAFALAVCFERMGNNWQALRILDDVLAEHADAAPSFQMLYTLNGVAATALGAFHRLHGLDVDEETAAHLATARSAAERARELLEQFDNPVYRVAVEGNLGEALTYQGDLDAASTLLHGALARASEIGASGTRRPRSGIDRRLAGALRTPRRGPAIARAADRRRRPRRPAQHPHPRPPHGVPRGPGARTHERAIAHHETYERLERLRTTNQLRASR
jgi:heat shock protein HslJ